MYTLSAPLDVQWEITPWCCYNCVHCYNYWRRGVPPRRVISTQELSIHRKTAEEIVGQGVFHVTLTGGEPLGVLEQVFPILRFLADSGVHLTMNTNLALFTEKKGELLKELGIQSLLTSLLASEESLNDRIAGRKGAFSSTLRGIKRATQEGFRVSVNMVVSTLNHQVVYETGELAHRYGAVAFAATKVAKPSNAVNFDGYLLSLPQLQTMFTDLLELNLATGMRVDSLEPYPPTCFPDSQTRELFGKRRCSAGRASCTIGSNGEVRPCSHSSSVYGSVLDPGLRGAWSALSDWRNGTYIPEVCLACDSFGRSCNGGCRVEAKNAGSGLGGMDPYCSQGVSRRVERKRPNLAPCLTVTRVVLSSKVRFRAEPFGYIIYKNSARWQALDRWLGERLQQSQPLGVAEISEHYGVSEKDALDTLTLLLYKDLVRETTQDGR